MNVFVKLEKILCFLLSPHPPKKKVFFFFCLFCRDFKQFISFIYCLVFFGCFYTCPWKSICDWGYFPLSTCSIIGHLFFPPACIRPCCHCTSFSFALFPGMRALPFFFLSDYLTLQSFHIGLVDSCCIFSFRLCVQPLYFTWLCVTPSAICHTFVLLLLWVAFHLECLIVVNILFFFEH